MSAAHDMNPVTPEAKLETLAELCGALAAGIDSAISVLDRDVTDTAAVDLVLDALTRLGWIAEEAEALAGGSIQRIGDTHVWLLGLHRGKLSEPGLERIRRAGAERRSAILRSAADLLEGDRT